MRFCPECQAQFGLDVERCPHDGAPLLVAPDKDAPPLERNALQRLQPVEAGNSRYTIISKIGQGGWGGVYRAYQHSTKREVALKVLRQEVAHDDLARRRFHREAEAVSLLKHPNTVTIFDFGETDDGLLFIAMEFIDGIGLDEVIRQKGTLPPLQAIRIARQIALSLAEAHEKGVVHRDVKPHNIMLTSLDDGDDFVKVLDFGVAKLASVDSNLTTTGATFGTPEYMSPEQVQSKGIDARSDLYALGVILYQMLAGVPPFSGNSAVTVALSHIRKRPPAIRSQKNLPKPLRSLVKRLLAKTPGERPQTARAVAAELDRIERRIVTQVSSNTTQAFQQAASAVTSNWTVALTLFGTVCLIVIAVAVLRGKLTTEPAEEASTESARPALNLVVPDVTPQSRAEEIGSADLTPEPSAPDDIVVDAGVLLVDVVPEMLEVPDVEALALAADVGRGIDVTPEAGRTVPPDVAVLTLRDLAPAGREPRSEDVVSGRTVPPEDRLPPRETVQRIVANVKGADVRVAGKTVCHTPCMLTGRPGERRRVKVVKSGYVTAGTRFTFARGAKPLYIELRPVSLSEEDGLKVAPTPAEEDGLK